MCGIVGYIGQRNALEVIVNGLEKLEYRGYDSAGVSVYDGSEVHRIRAAGKLAELKKVLETESSKIDARIGIGHTRWATHGKPSEKNAHPHAVGRVHLIHNGIIENYLDLKEELAEEGRDFSSETDTEVASHLLDRALDSGKKPFDAIADICDSLKGSFAFLAMDKQNPDRLLVAKNATPIIVGLGKDEVFVASDIPAVLEFTRDVVILEDGDIAEVQIGRLQVKNSGKLVDRPVQHITWDPVTAQKGGYRHFMMKEIHEQGEVAADALRGRVDFETLEVLLDDCLPSKKDIESLERIVLVACGTAWHACLVLKFYLEKLLKIPCEVDYASEFRYRSPVINDQTLVIAVSQSGETADTLAAIDVAVGTAKTLAICNVVGSSIARKVDHVMYTHAGPEISVASTKAFTTQVICGFLLSIALGVKRKTLSQEEARSLVRELIYLPAAIDLAVEESSVTERIAKKIYQSGGFLFIGRGILYPIALEGALKLKEISYIHAEGYPAGEMKHGPIALVDEEMPVIALLPRDELMYEKTLSNIKEIESRGGRIVIVTDKENAKEIKDVAMDQVAVPPVSEFLRPIIFTIPLQLLAYHVADLNGTDVDLPRNLAKSVTVE